MNSSFSPFDDCHVLVSKDARYTMLAIESVSQHLLGWKVSDCIGQSFEVLQGPETDKKILHGA